MRITKTNPETFPPNDKNWSNLNLEPSPKTPLVVPAVAGDTWKQKIKMGSKKQWWLSLATPGGKADWKQKINRNEQKSGTEKMGSKKQWWLCQMWLATPVNKIIGNKRKL